MSSISFNPAGLLSGNGIDVNSVVSQILSNQSGILNVWQQQQTNLVTQAGLLSGMNTDLGNLANAVQALSDPLGPLSAMAATSSQPDVLTATADTSAVAASHLITVTSLATVGTVYTDAVSNPAASFLTGGKTTGDLALRVGGSGGITRDIPITQGSNDTLNSLASYINNQNWGVSASVINDASGARLAIYSQSTGSSGALAITNNSNTSLTFQNPVGGANAVLNVDGVPFQSPGNVVSGAIPGVTLNLVSAAPGSQVQLTVGSDSSQVTQAVNNFVSAYNTIVGDINQQFTVDPTTNTEGPLGSDSSLRYLQSALLADATYSVTGNSGLVNLASLGINMNDDGTLSVDSTQLNSVLNSNPAAVLNFFQNTSGTGFANNFNSDLMNLTDPTQGILSLDLTQNHTEQQGIASQISDFQSRLVTQQQQLISQYSAVNALLQEYPLLLQAVTQQLGVTTPTSSTSSSSSSGA